MIKVKEVEERSKGGILLHWTTQGGEVVVTSLIS